LVPPIIITKKSDRIIPPLFLFLTYPFMNEGFYSSPVHKRGVLVFLTKPIVKLVLYDKYFCVHGSGSFSKHVLRKMLHSAKSASKKFELK